MVDLSSLLRKARAQINGEASQGRPFAEVRGTPNDGVFNGRLFSEPLFSRGDQASLPCAGGADT